ncbi:N-acyl amino acid synthase, PEP-CTERM/exosortase system-associated [Geoalkalibacter ferrihydriticus]|uniref:N-acyl amino acid synthase, PEP-CTERM/exosortase system-associated n=1 Tax=Geoalkalibacter ferrihydriticus TaxID=392333 RepID=A0A1G9WMQ7_9BACT|nr:PEP-CTERM/exosortase system-associated acyltransferase [Geoalkalibacter ferrihydriticus]SDM85808.1 N-acyl amino acid synthase, PEP-CTERM/exosortase system-associated [Geoalkalibacter ferrihydriticus]
MSYFDFVEIKKNDPRIADVFKLRYKVYVEEWGFERAEDHPLGIETDEYDQQAIHIAAIRRETGAIIGTARLIPCSDMKFPIEKNMQMDRDVQGELRIKTCEISRLAVSKDYRRRAGDNMIYNGEVFSAQGMSIPEDERRSGENDIVLGLIRKICEFSGREGFTHWYVGMAKGLYILLKRRKMNFTPIGPEIDYHGLRRPYFGRVDEIVAGNEDFSTIYHQAESLSVGRAQELSVAI